MKIQTLLGVSILCWLISFNVRAGEIVMTKHLMAAPAPIDEPPGLKTPDGSFNVRDPQAPFHSNRLADALMLDRQGQWPNGEYLNLNHAVYTAYGLADDPGPPTTVLVLMPGTWAGAMSMDSFARDVLRLSKAAGRTGLQVWLLDRRSEQLEDHTGLRWAIQNPDRLSTRDRILGLNNYYKPAFDPTGESLPLLSRKFTPLDQDAARFMANWGADSVIRDWRAVVLAAHRQVGNEVVGNGPDDAKVVKKPGRRVFIGGHSLGGSLTVLYAAYDFDRRPDHEILGADDVDGLVLLEGGGLRPRPVKTESAESYRRSLADKYRDGKVFFDLDILGIRYAPSTMLSVPIAAWAADNARGEESIFPAYSRPRTVRLPHVTNEAVLALAMDDDFSPFFIARASIGTPTGKIGFGGQLRSKTSTVPLDPGECGLLTPWWPGHRPLDPDFLYGWQNIDQPSEHCSKDDSEVTDFYAFARSLYNGADEFEEAPGLAAGPNDFAEWYFPPRLSTDSGKLGGKIVTREGLELLNGTHLNEIALPVISFTGDDSMGQFSVPTLDDRHFTPGSLKHPATAVHLIRGYTHLDISAATRNNQPDLKPDFENYNACAVYAYRFMAKVAGW